MQCLLIALVAAVAVQVYVGPFNCQFPSSTSNITFQNEIPTSD